MPENAFDSDNFSGFPHGQMAQAGDQPWFCWFNNTVLEFFIYPGHSAMSAMSTSGSSMPSATSLANAGLASTTFSTSTYPGGKPPWESPAPQDRKDKRYYGYGGEYERDEHPNYPTFTKLEDKRKPGENTQPYCQQMDILYDGLIVPSESQRVISISEIEPAAATYYKRDTDDGSMSSLDTECACVWLWDG